MKLGSRIRFVLVAASIAVACHGCGDSGGRNEPDPPLVHVDAGTGAVDAAIPLIEDPCALPAARCNDPMWPPNVLLIIMDDIGLDLVATYGLADDAPPTPTLDALAANGVTFTSAYSQPWCSPTRADILTGRNSPRSFGFGRAIRIEEPGDVSLALDVVSLPEALDASGRWSWDHALVGKWHMTTIAEGAADAANRHGFRRFLGGLGNLYQRHAIDGQLQDYFSWERSVDGRVARSSVYATTQGADDAIEVLGELASPWLLWFASFSAHDPWQPPPDDLHSYGDLSQADPPTIVRAMVESLDREIGRVLDSLPAAVRDNTLVIALGDNGTTTGVDTPAWRGLPTKSTVYEGGVHVPFIVSGAFIDRPGRVHDGLVHVRDVFATVLDIAGVPRSERPSGLDSVSLLPQLLDADAASERSMLTSESYEPNGGGPFSIHQGMARDDRFKLVQRQGAPDELYDMQGLLFEGDPLDLAALDADAASAYEVLRAHLEGGN